jgi:hypothetical protein
MMGESIKATGKMVNNTVKVNFYILKKVYGREESGVKGAELNGRIQLLLNNGIIFTILMMNFLKFPHTENRFTLNIWIFIF